MNIMDYDLFNDLEKFHLSNYEIKAYSCLLMNGPMKATEIIKETGIPQPRMYDILGKLQKRGLILINSSLKKTYEAVMPADAFKEELINMEKYVNQLDTFIKINKKKIPAKSPNVWFIENDSRIETKLEESIEAAKTEIILSLPETRIRYLLPVMRKAYNNGVTICSVLGNNVGSSVIKLMSEIGVVRTRDVTPAEIVIVDRKLSFLNAKSITEGSDYSVFIQEDELVDIMGYYFYYMNWIPSKYETDFSQFRKLKISTSWLACEAIDNILEKRKRINATLKGIYSLKEVDMKGEIKSTVRIQGVKQSFILSTPDRDYTVGGKNGKLEDVRMIELNMDSISI